MTKARPAGRPAKLAGSGRKFIRSFTESANLEDNECNNISKQICFGLTVFQATFGLDDTEQESLFHGFSPHEIRLAADKSRIRTSQVEQEYRVRGALFTPFTLGRSTLLPISSTAAISNNCETKVERYTVKRNNAEKNLDPLRTVLKKENLLFKKQKKSIVSVKIRSSPKKLFNTIPNDRAIAKGFVLPVRSAHSSRVIKPNKRFRDIDSDSGSCDSDGKVMKKPKLTSASRSDPDPCLKKIKVEEQSDSESEQWGTASANVTDLDFCPKAKSKVILRKAKLKVEPDLPVIGPFSSVVPGDPDLVPQKVVCGVCGAVRWYRYLKQARKFGIFSCESCRKFISRVISQGSTPTLPCKLETGTCIVPPYQKDPMTGERSKESRCKACWLKICLRCYCMPAPLAARLAKKLPSYMNKGLPLVTDVHSVQEKGRQKIRRYLYKLSTKVSDKVVEKRIKLAKTIRKRAEATVCKDSRTKQDVPSVAKNSEGKLVCKQQSGIVSTKIKRNYSALDMEKKCTGKRQGKASDMKKIRKENSYRREEKLIRLQKLKGPRVKHVCRSASLVLGQPVATFTDASPTKQNKFPLKSNSDLEKPTSSLTHLDRFKDESNGHKDMYQGNITRTKQSANHDVDSGFQTKSKYNSSKKLNSTGQHSEENALDGKARTLQDLTRQHHELVHGVGLKDDTSTISITFWESYDPEEICKTGFALIGTGNTFETKAICFICGSAGLDKMIHCACCCEPFHRYCIEGMPQDSKEWWRVDWVCVRCTLCTTCGKGGGPQVSCQRCHKSHHSECLAADRVASRHHSSDRPWVCPTCLCCKSCNKSEVYKFVGNLPLCQNCFRLRQKGNFCPLCQRCYAENDFDTKMMECEQCKCWVHAKCEGLSNENYEILSLLPDSVEFLCRKCSSCQPASWRLAIEAEMKAGLLAVLKSLSKNRKACALLKSSPTKRSIICACGERRSKFPELSEQSDVESLDPNETIMKKELDNEECLRKEVNLSTEIKSKNDKNVSLFEPKTKYSFHDCPDVFKNEELKLKVENELLGYQNSEDKLAQFSPHATSQSDSGIGSTDDELKSTNDQCFCTRSELWTKTHPTLLTIKKRVNSNEYKSLGQFNFEMEEIIGTVQGPELFNLYKQSLEEVFPWFNSRGPEVIDQMTVENTVDSIKIEKVVPRSTFEGYETRSCCELEGKLNKNSDYYYNIKQIIDSRICVLCKLVGEGETTEEGRLLYCGHNDWIHTNCALWSNEVFEEIDGSLQNVQSAISRSRHIRCSKCSKKGASIGCCNRSCPEAYHFNCAKSSHCIFFEDKSLFCANHRNDSKASRVLLAVTDFIVSRPIYVELDPKRKKCIPKHNVQVIVGSLAINSLGDFVPDLSDEKSSIIPINFQCSRLYWSSVEPWRLVCYKICTKIVYTVSDDLVDNDNNITIDHSIINSTGNYDQLCEIEVKQLLECIVDRVCSKDGTYKTTLVEDGQDEPDCPTNKVIYSKENDKFSGETDKTVYLKNEDKVICPSDKKQTVSYKVEEDPTVCSKEEEEAQATADILPPELEQEIFEDLPHDILDGISMQDIFPRLLPTDTSALENKPFTECQSKTKPKKLKLEIKKPFMKTCINLNDNKIQTTSQCSVFLKRLSTVKTGGVKRVFEDKSACDKWSSPKIVQIDGAGDCSENSNCSSPDHDELCNDIQSSTIKKMFQAQTSRKPRILQVDGVDESNSLSSTSNSECGSPLRDEKTYWKLGQLDGTTDIGTCTDQLEENPVKCTRCHRTYRTALSFERHLQSCSADYILSFSESESSEEEKTNGPQIIDIASTDDEQTSYNSEHSDTVVEHEDIKQENEKLFPNNSADSMSINISRNINNEQSVGVVENGTQQNPISNVENILVTKLSHASLSPPPTMFDCGNQLGESSEVAPSLSLPLKTYTRKPKMNTYSTMCVTETDSKPCQYNTTVIDCQTSSASPALILQQIPTHNTVSPYIESVPTPATSNNLHYQFITTINTQEKPQIPLTIQLQPQINIQPVMPTVFGTLVQPSGIEQLVVNTAAPTVEVLNQQPVFITNMNHPVYMGVETVISNSVSQFVSDSYSAKAVPQSYIVVNSQSSPMPQNVFSPQPWTYNYEETYKVKEKTTYQQVTRQIIQDKNQSDSVTMFQSNQTSILMDNPVIKEVTVEKTRSFHKTASIPNFVNNINPLLLVNTGLNQSQPIVKKSVVLKELSSTPMSRGPTHCIVKELPKKLDSRRSDQVKKEITFTRSNNINFNLNYMPTTNCENINKKTCARGDNKQIYVTTSATPIKPVITNTKLNPNKITCNIRINISNEKEQERKTIKINNVSNDGSSTAVTTLPCARDVFESPKATFKGKDSTLKCSEKVWNFESTEDIRFPLKENKTVTNKTKVNKPKKKCSVNNVRKPKLVYEISSQEGLSVSSQDLSEAWRTIYEAVQSARVSKSLPLLPQNPFVSHLRILGLDNHSVKYLVEQVPGDGCCTKYEPIYHKSKWMSVNNQLSENPTGCARTEPCSNSRRKYDMFSWLASRHRQPPKLIINSDTEIINGVSRRATSLNLPMAMRFRHLKETSKESVGVFRSDIHGRGLFCLRDIDSGEMVIEYAGEVIRAGLTDMRENHYTSKGIGCYMFRIDDHFVVDATMHGNAARFINHSCEPNCYSRVVDILGKKHILIFALRKIPQGEELTYDYKFPLEDDKITCHCLSRKCRKYLN